MGLLKPKYLVGGFKHCIINTINVYNIDLLGEIGKV